MGLELTGLDRGMDRPVLMESDLIFCCDRGAVGPKLPLIEFDVSLFLDCEEGGGILV